MQLQCPNPACYSIHIKTLKWSSCINRGTTFFSRLWTNDLLWAAIFLVLLLGQIFTFAGVFFLPIMYGIPAVILVNGVILAISGLQNRKPKLRGFRYTCQQCKNRWVVVAPNQVSGAVLLQGARNEAEWQRKHGSTKKLAMALDILGLRTCHYDHNYPEAIMLYEESLALQRALGDKKGTAHALNNLGWTVAHCGDYVRAQTLLEESVATFRDLKAWQSLTFATNSLGFALLYQNKIEPAREHFVSSLNMGKGTGHNSNIISGLEGLAGVAITRSQPQRAARLYGAAQRLREYSNDPVEALIYPLYMHYVNAGRTQLPEPAFSTVWTEGRAMSLEQAIAYALTEEKRVPVALG